MVEYYSVSDMAAKRHSVSIESLEFPQDKCNGSDTEEDRKTGNHIVFKFFTIQAQNGEIVSTFDMHTVSLYTCLVIGQYYVSEMCKLSTYMHMWQSWVENKHYLFHCILR